MLSNRQGANYLHLPTDTPSLDRTVLRLHVARSGNLFILFAGFNGANRGQLERCCRVVVVVTPATVGRQDNVATAHRGSSAKWVWKPPDERSTCAEIKASQGSTA
jgi:hypothetical protein